MNHSYMRRGALAFTTLAMCAAPALASAQTTSDIQSQIQSLLTQISSLRQQLIQMAASSTTTGSATTTPPAGPCPLLNRDLQIGAQGNDVTELQQFLSQTAGVFQGPITGFFGAQTAQAIQRFQAQNGIATSSVGSVGPRTRAFLQNRCGGGAPRVSTSTPPLTWVNGSTTPPHIGDEARPPFPPAGNGSTTPPTPWHEPGTTTPRNFQCKGDSPCPPIQAWLNGSTTPPGPRPDGDSQGNGPSATHGVPPLPQQFNPFQPH